MKARRDTSDQILDPSRNQESPLLVQKGPHIPLDKIVSDEEEIAVHSQMSMVAKTPQSSLMNNEMPQRQKTLYDEKKFQSLEEGNILNLKKDKEVKKSKPALEAISAEFSENLDNFDGTQNIKNYCIISIKDNLGHGDVSMGVLQLFNKLDGRPIDKDDLARI